MIRLIIHLKKRKLASDLEKLRCVLEKLIDEIMKEILAIPESALRTVSSVGKRGAAAGSKLRRIIREMEEERKCLKK